MNITMPNPCPFCAALDWTIMRIEFEGEQCRQVKCNHCGARGPHSAWMQASDKHAMMQDAVTEWNKAGVSKAWLLTRRMSGVENKEFTAYWPQRPTLDQLRRVMDGIYPEPMLKESQLMTLLNEGKVKNQDSYHFKLQQLDPINRPLDGH